KPCAFFTGFRKLIHLPLIICTFIIHFLTDKCLIMKASKTYHWLLSGISTAILMIFFSTAGFGQTSQTLKGEVLDLSCYMTSGATGKGHKACAQGCLDKGLPAGILNKADGKVYLLVEDHKKSDAYKSALKHAADNVE